MNRRTRVAVGGALTGVILLLGGALTAGASTSQTEPDETDVPITGSALSEASAAALTSTGEGSVTGTEVGDEESYYEVEVTLDNGTEVDVQLDESFTVVASEPDSATED